MKVARTVLNGESGSNAADLHNKRFFELMQNKTEYCNSLVSKVLPIIYKVSDNYFIFS